MHRCIVSGGVCLGLLAGCCSHGSTAARVEGPARQWHCHCLLLYTGMPVPPCTFAMSYRLGWFSWCCCWLLVLLLCALLGWLCCYRRWQAQHLVLPFICGAVLEVELACFKDLRLLGTESQGCCLQQWRGCCSLDTGSLRTCGGAAAAAAAMFSGMPSLARRYVRLATKDL